MASQQQPFDIDTAQEQLLKKVNGLDFGKNDDINKVISSKEPSVIVSKLYELFKTHQQISPNFKVSKDDIDNFVGKCINNDDLKSPACRDYLLNPNQTSSDFYKFIINFINKTDNIDALVRFAILLGIKIISYRKEGDKIYVQSESLESFKKRFDEEIKNTKENKQKKDDNNKTKGGNYNVTYEDDDEQDKGFYGFDDFVENNFESIIKNISDDNLKTKLLDFCKTYSEEFLYDSKKNDLYLYQLMAYDIVNVQDFVYCMLVPYIYDHFTAKIKDEKYNIFYENILLHKYGVTFGNNLILFLNWYKTLKNEELIKKYKNAYDFYNNALEYVKTNIFDIQKSVSVPASIPKPVLTPEQSSKIIMDDYYRLASIVITKFENYNRISKNEANKNPINEPYMANFRNQVYFKELPLNSISATRFVPNAYLVNTLYGGAYYQFKKNENQSVVILRKIFDYLIKELRLHNKILNNEDIEKIYNILNIMESTEDELTKLMVNILNNLKNADYETQQKSFDELNIVYQKKQTKLYTLTQKINAIFDQLIKDGNINLAKN